MSDGIRNSADMNGNSESEDMGTMLEQEIKGMDNIREHEVVKGTVVQVTDDEAVINIGYKQEIPVPKRELARPEPESAKDVVKVGDVIDVYIQSLSGENGGALSKVKADNMTAWREIEKIKDSGESVEARVTQVVKGGLVAFVSGLRGFIPASQVELHFVKDLNVYVGKTFPVLILEIDPHKQRLVLSRRQLLETERAKKQEEIFDTLEAGQTVKGVVKRIVDYGAFIDIGGVDGLAHISDLSWERIKKPSDVISVGDEIDVYIKNIDPESHRISLSVKDTLRDPWLDKAENYSEGDFIEGRIIKLTDFGAFMEIEPGFDGLIPMGELSDRRIERADEAVHNGDIVRVKVMRIDMKRKRISLSINRAARAGENVVFKAYKSVIDEEPAEE